jgi:hypothetical protein
VSPTTIQSGTRTDTAFNTLGQVVQRTVRAVTNGVPYIVLARQTYSYSGVLGRDYTVVDLAGRTNQFFYACCGLESTVDAGRGDDLLRIRRP